VSAGAPQSSGALCFVSVSDGPLSIRARHVAQAGPREVHGAHDPADERQLALTVGATAVERRAMNPSIAVEDEPLPRLFSITHVGVEAARQSRVVARRRAGHLTLAKIRPS
jgi:hypothetical protein